MTIFNPKNKLDKLHPDLVSVINSLDLDFDVLVCCTTRDQVAQEAAKTAGNSNAHFGQSPHNFIPSLAVDLCPCSEDGKELWWDRSDLFDKLKDEMLDKAKQLNIDITWGGTFKSLKDKPHFQMSNWQTYVKQGKVRLAKC